MLLISIKSVAQSDSVELREYRSFEKYNPATKKYEPQPGGKVVVCNYTTGFVIVRGKNDLGESYKITNDTKAAKHWVIEGDNQKSKSKCKMDMYKDAVYNYFKCECADGSKFILKEPLKN